MKSFLLFCLFGAGIIYGSSANLIHSWTIEQPLGYIDGRSYIKMANLDFDVPPVHRYRLLIPVMVHEINKIIRPQTPVSDDLGSKRIFWVINFVFLALASGFLGMTLSQLKFSWPECLLGITFFSASRVCGYTAAMPLVDSSFLTMIAFLFWGLSNDSKKMIFWAFVLGPISKEVFLGFALPFLWISHLRIPAFLGSLLGLGIVFLTHKLVHIIDPREFAWNYTVVADHFLLIATHLKGLFTARGFYDLVNPFLFSWPFIFLGLHSWKDFPKQRKLFCVTWFALLFLYALLSSNYGRVIFLGFPILMVFALHGVRRLSTHR